MRGRERCGADAFDHAIERKFQLVRLVKGDLEYTGNDLSAAGEALRRRVDERQPIGCQTAVMRNLGNQSGRRRTAALEDECAVVALSW